MADDESPPSDELLVDPDPSLGEIDDADLQLAAEQCADPVGDKMRRSLRGTGIDVHDARYRAVDADPLPSAIRDRPPSTGWETFVTSAPPEWFTTPPPRRMWLLRDARTRDAKGRSFGVLPLAKVGILIAEGGIGKTMVFTQFAVCIATGVRAFGALDVAVENEAGEVTTGRVLLILGEEDAAEAHRRLFNAKRSMGPDVPPLDSIVVIPLAGVAAPMIERAQTGDPIEGAFLVWLRDYAVQRGPWSLICIDPLSRFAGLDAETDNAAATRFIQGAESIAVATGATVLIAHHTNKVARGGGAVSTSAARGSSAFTDGARWVATLASEEIKGLDADVEKRLGRLVRFEFTKANYGPPCAPILLRRDLDNGGALLPLDEDDVSLVDAAREGTDPRAQRTARKTAERQAREQADANARIAAAAQREASMRERNAADDEAARATLAANPDAPARDIVALLKTARACGTDRAREALSRVRGEK